MSFEEFGKNWVESEGYRITELNRVSLMACLDFWPVVRACLTLAGKVAVYLINIPGLQDHCNQDFGLAPLLSNY